MIIYNECPQCGQEGTFPSINNEMFPEPNDVCVCVNCTNICKYTSDMKVVSVTEGEMMVIHDNDVKTYMKIKMVQSLLSGIFGRKPVNTINLN